MREQAENRRVRMTKLLMKDGFEFTEEDLLQSTEITDAELAHFAGGLTGVVGDDWPDQYGGIIG